MAPDNDRVWALRLNGQLLLGYVRIHGLKVTIPTSKTVTSDDAASSSQGVQATRDGPLPPPRRRRCSRTASSSRATGSASSSA